MSEQQLIAATRSSHTSYLLSLIRQAEKQEREDAVETICDRILENTPSEKEN